MSGGLVLFHANGSRWGKVFQRHFSVYPHDISKIDEARITKLEIQNVAP